MEVIIDGVRYVPELQSGPITSFQGLIKKSREQLGMTLEEFAGCIGCSKSYVWEMENGKSLPGFQILKKLRWHVGIPAEDLLLADTGN